MIIALPVTAGLGQVGQTWGRAATVAVAVVDAGEITSWAEHQVGWDISHDAGSHGSHHGLVMRFLREQGIEAVAAPHVGPGMVRMLDSAGLALVTGIAGDARAAALAVAAALEEAGEQA